ncbi:MaoC family dehydratase [Hoeflea sp. YIM 152468]|uniref:MaoC family dehydratase n=1 Tax=Hoeflea sp. YIM 152468 TaxID=3031759 RepID=UPI0023DCC460|nr:MaoC family dehydratase [Hoeflea sp. YIM 152468]MDF1609694.1 MaoC family dehydratase [Hoeflea sp. YIM 152468]
MTNDPAYQPGARQELGSFVFTEESIIDFARQFDPQRFHVDKDAARDSVFGGLCASGWHTAATWMKLNIRSLATEIDKARAEGRAIPEFGPSPGFRNLRWFKPVFAGDEIFYARVIKGTRPLKSRPGWSIFETVSEARDAAGDLVMSFDSAALIRFPDDGEAAS